MSLSDVTKLYKFKSTKSTVNQTLISKDEIDYECIIYVVNMREEQNTVLCVISNKTIDSKHKIFKNF